MINYKYLTNFFIISAGIIMAFILNNNSEIGQMFPLSVHPLGTENEMK